MARRFVDLHTHSTASDGSCWPERLIASADKAGLAAVALTDHDTLAGLAAAARAAAECPQLRFVPGIEISAVYGPGVMHILGLNIDPAAEPIATLAETLRKAREQRNPKILARLGELGIAITMDDVLAEVGGSQDPADRVVSRMHISQALVKLGAARTIQDAFGRFTGKEGAAYVEKERLAPGEAIGAIVASGGIAFLAHPPELRCENRAQLERLVRELKDVALGGLEVYHSSHSPEQTRTYLDLARRLGLAISGGSDYHGRGKPEVSLGHPRVPIEMIDWL
jgi:3',5'-nucleoside bisphosphate phosphatase